MKKQPLSEDAELQGRLWGQAAEAWLEIMEPRMVPVWTPVIESLALQPGEDFLDAGCGTGGASLLALSRGVRVSAFDASAKSVEIASNRLPGAALKTGDLQSIPFNTASFDAAAAINSVQFTANPVQALRELRRVTRAGGRIAVVVWASPGHSDFEHIFEAVMALYPKRPSGMGPLHLSDPAQLDDSIRAAGLSLLGELQVESPVEFPGIEIAVRGQLSVGPTLRAIQILGEEPVRAAITAVFSRFRTGVGEAVRMVNRFRLVLLS